MKLTSAHRPAGALRRRRQGVTLSSLVFGPSAPLAQNIALACEISTCALAVSTLTPYTMMRMFVFEAMLDYAVFLCSARCFRHFSGQLHDPGLVNRGNVEGGCHRRSDPHIVKRGNSPVRVCWVALCIPPGLVGLQPHCVECPHLQPRGRSGQETAGTANSARTPLRLS